MVLRCDDNMPLVRTFRTDVGFLEDEVAYRRALTAVPDFRKRKAEAFCFDKDRRLSVGAWLLLRYALARVGFELSDREFEYGEFGKPEISGAPHFNVSHSAASVMCAVCADCAVGCDVEAMKTFDERLARFCMQPAEVEEMLALPADERSWAFYRRWTLKESYMKARGAGLQLPPDSFAVTLPAVPAGEGRGPLADAASELGPEAGDLPLKALAAATLAFAGVSAGKADEVAAGRKGKKGDCRASSGAFLSSTEKRGESGAAPACPIDSTCSFAEFIVDDGNCYAACTLDARAQFAAIEQVSFAALLG